jgi:hypothetical protein
LQQLWVMLEEWAAARMDTKFRDKKFRGNFMKFHKLLQYVVFSQNFREIFSKIHENCQKIANLNKNLRRDYEILRNFSL